MSERLTDRACEIQFRKMTEQLRAELERKEPEPDVVDLRTLFPDRAQRERVEESF